MVVGPPPPTTPPGRLIFPTLALMAGISAAYAGLPAPAFNLLPLVALPLLYSLLRQPAGRLPLFYLLPLLFLAAGYNLAHSQLQEPQKPSHLYQQLLTRQQGEAATTLQQSHDLVLVGRLQQLPRPAPHQRTRLLLAADELHLPGERQPSGHHLTVSDQQSRQISGQGLVLITVNGKLDKTIQPGDTLMVRARVGPVWSFKVPGAFDYQEFLARRGIQLSGWAASPAQIIKVYPHATAGSASNWRYLPERWRQDASQLLEQHLPDHPRLPLLKALLIGERSEVAPAVLESFKAAGAMHLLAISGMHLGMVAMLATVAGQWLLSRSSRLLLLIPARKPALLLALLPVVGYALITGLNPPAQRALIMTLVFMAAYLLNRQWCSLNNLALAALLILLLEPLALTGASFQLSFAATAGIITLVPSLQNRYARLAELEGSRRRLYQLWFWLTASLLVSAVATLVTAPLSLYHFHRLSLLSPLSTLLATPPLFFWTLPLALAGLGLGALGLPGAGWLLNAAGRGLDLTTAMIGQLAALPGSFFYFSPPGPLELAAWLLLFAALLLLKSQRVGRGKRDSGGGGAAAGYSGLAPVATAAAAGQSGKLYRGRPR
ncbi:MAG: ComEC/Rec2 family competence protein [Desulfurivibrio sp.]|nr:ComEC/Rec2 family competence protein [Desulfurivibrio sp.]